MKDNIAQMSKSEFRELVETVIEQKLIELLGDPDDGLTLRKAVRARLQRQQNAVRAGERGRPLDDVARKLGLE